MSSFREQCVIYCQHPHLPNREKIYEALETRESEGLTKRRVFYNNVYHSNTIDHLAILRFLKYMMGSELVNQVMKFHKEYEIDLKDTIPDVVLLNHTPNYREAFNFISHELYPETTKYFNDDVFFELCEKELVSLIDDIKCFHIFEDSSLDYAAVISYVECHSFLIGDPNNCLYQSFYLSKFSSKVHDFFCKIFKFDIMFTQL